MPPEREVAEPERVAFGPLRLGDLPLGKHRVLRPAEVEELRKLTAHRSPRRRARR